MTNISSFLTKLALVMKASQTASKRDKGFRVIDTANNAFHKQIQRVLSAGLILLVMLFVALPAQSQTVTDPIKVQSVLYNAANQSIGLVAQEGKSYGGDFSTVKLSQPDRLIIDVPNAFLSTPTRNLPIHQNGIDHVELSQSLGTFYQVVRLTVFVTKAEALNNIQVQTKDNTLLVNFNNTASQSQAMVKPPLPPQNADYSFLDGHGAVEVSSKYNVIQSATFQNGIFKLNAKSGQVLAIKNQFTLTGPNRLVIDIANTVLADKSLTKPMDVTGGPVRNIRLGQYDESTVRIVVETSRPNGLYLVYPGEDKSQIALSTNLNPSIRTLPIENQNVGFIQDVNLTKRDEVSVVKIATSDPMVRRLVRRGDQIEIELINIAAKPSFIAYDKQEFSDIKEIRLSPLSAEEPNTKVIIKLGNTSVDMDSHLSMDGRSLEITLTPRMMAKTYRSTKMPTIISPSSDGSFLTPVPPVKKGAFTVVVDAGHGGKDLGANRVGVYEKDLNLSVALKVKQALEARGVTVHMTRATDMFLELSQITGITNRIRPDAFVSVHTNASVNPSADGLETYYYTPQSRDLAVKVHRRMVNNVNSPDRGVRTARFYVVHHTSVPAILCETGYISNPAERASLQSDARQRATAEAIAQGVVEFLGKSLKADASPQGDKF